MTAAIEDVVDRSDPDAMEELLTREISPAPRSEKDDYWAQKRRREEEAAAEKAAKASEHRDEEKARLRPMGIVELRDRKKKRGPRRWLIRGILIEASPAVIGAPEKTGKTLNMVDLAHAIATGGKWMNHYQVEQSGTVVVFAAEDDEDEILRRWDAVCRFYGTSPDEVDVHFVFAVPNLSDKESMAVLAEYIAELKPVAVILDPLYLAAGEDSDGGSNLYKMGALLNRFRDVCRPTRTSPIVVTHFKKTSGSEGSNQITGTGTTQWARTIMWGEQKQNVMTEDGKNVVILQWHIKGNSVSLQSVSIKRTMWSDDPDDLESDLHYEIEQVAEISPSASQETSTGKSPLSSEERVLRALEKHGGWMTKHEVQTWDANNLPLKADGNPASFLKVDTVYRALKGHFEAGLIGKQPRGREDEFTLTEPFGPGDVEGEDAQPAADFLEPTKRPRFSEFGEDF